MPSLVESENEEFLDDSQICESCHYTITTTTRPTSLPLSPLFLSLLTGILLLYYGHYVHYYSKHLNVCSGPKRRVQQGRRRMPSFLRGTQLQTGVPLSRRRYCHGGRKEGCIGVRGLVVVVVVVVVVWLWWWLGGGWGEAPAQAQAPCQKLLRGEEAKPPSSWLTAPNA